MQADWQSFLQQQSANISDGLVLDFGDPLLERSQVLNENNITDLSQLDVLEIKGKDAIEFLHGQFSSDVAALASNQLQLSSWCSIKGRVIASFILYRSEDSFFLLLARDLTELVHKRLQMFVMRANVSINNRSDDLIRIGIRGESVHHSLQQFIETNAQNMALTILPLQDAIPRSIVLVPLEHAPALWQQIAVQAVALGSSPWSLYDIMAGIAWVGLAGSDEFLPQSLNLDLTGGLSFNKGCYPGQEIIARMHFRGKLKQRLFLARVTLKQPAEIKSKLYTATANQHIGMVVNAALQADDDCLLLLILELEYHNKDSIHLGADDGPALTFLPLPYTIAS